MRTFVNLLVVFGLTTYFSTNAQQITSTKIYVLNASGNVFNKAFTIQSSLINEKPIRIVSQECAILETDADSLPLQINGQSVPIAFDRGQNYYYIVSSDYSNAFSVSEVTSRVFWLTAHINKLQKQSTYFMRSRLQSDKIK